MSEGHSENSKGIFGRIKERFSPVGFNRRRATLRGKLGQIDDKYKASVPTSINELLSLSSQRTGEVVGATAEAMVETLRGLSRETAEVSLENLMEEAQFDYTLSQNSRKEKDRIVAEANLRTAMKARARFVEIIDQFPSAVAYLSDLSPEERLTELNSLEKQAKEAKQRSDRTKKRDDLINSRVYSKMLVSARALVAEKESDQT